MGIGCQPCEAFGPVAPATPLDGALWVDSSSGPPYTLRRWNLSAAAWEVVGGGSLGGGGLVVLGDQTLAAPAGSFVFNTLPSARAYRLLVLARSTRAGSTQEQLGVQLNADTAAHYEWQLVYGNVASAAGAQNGADSMGMIGYTMAGGSPANEFSSHDVIIPAPRDTLALKAGTSVWMQRALLAGSCGWRWTSGAAITRIDVVLSRDTLAVGSRAILYGMG